MVRLDDPTYNRLTEIGRYQETIDQIVNRLTKYYVFNDVLEILNDRDKSLVPSRFMQKLCRLDQDAIHNGTPNEFMPYDLWDELGGYNFEKVYPVVEFYFSSYHRYIVTHPDGRISLTNAGRRSCDQEFVLPEAIKPSDMR